MKIWSIPLFENSNLPNITKKLSVCLASTNLERKWAFRQQARHGRRPNSRLVTPPPICTANVTSWPQGTNYFVTAVHRCCWRLFYLVLLYTYNDIVIGVDNDDIVDDHGDVDDNNQHCMNCRTCRTTTASTRQTSLNPPTFSSIHQLLRWLLMIVKRWHWYVSSILSSLFSVSQVF